MPGVSRKNSKRPAEPEVYNPYHLRREAQRDAVWNAVYATVFVGVYLNREDDGPTESEIRTYASRAASEAVKLTHDEVERGRPADPNRPVGPLGESR